MLACIRGLHTVRPQDHVVEFRHVASRDCVGSRHCLFRLRSERACSSRASPVEARGGSHGQRPFRRLMGSETQCLVCSKTACRGRMHGPRMSTSVDGLGQTHERLRGRATLECLPLQEPSSSAILWLPRATEKSRGVGVHEVSGLRSNGGMSRRDVWCELVSRPGSCRSVPCTQSQGLRSARLVRPGYRIHLVAGNFRVSREKECCICRTVNPTPCELGERCDGGVWDWLLR
jgi:hypothetical protein